MDEIREESMANEAEMVLISTCRAVKPEPKKPKREHEMKEI
jgi:hypothetical protein